MNIIEAAQALGEGKRVADPELNEVCLHQRGYLYVPGCPLTLGYLKDILSDKWTVVEDGN